MDPIRLRKNNHSHQYVSLIVNGSSFPIQPPELTGPSLISNHVPNRIRPGTYPKVPLQEIEALSSFSIKMVRFNMFYRGIPPIFQRYLDRVSSSSNRVPWIRKHVDPQIPRDFNRIFSFEAMLQKFGKYKIIFKKKNIHPTPVHVFHWFPRYKPSALG